MAAVPREAGGGRRRRRQGSEGGVGRVHVLDAADGDVGEGGEEEDARGEGRWGVGEAVEQARLVVDGGEG